jgi:CO/xanthine dehydrogenase FAD-binding subunit
VPIKGSEFTATFDAVIKAIGEEPDLSLLPSEFSAAAQKGPAAQGPAVHVGKNLFAGGDLLSGPSTVAQAIGSGREAARLILQSLKLDWPAAAGNGKGRMFASPSFVAASRVRVARVSASERVKSLDAEETRGVNLSDAGAEALRCFNCGCVSVGPSDIGIALVALDATIVTNKRTIEAQDFFSTSATELTKLRNDELITEIRIPKQPEGARQKYLKFTLREPVDFAIVSVASVIAEKSGVCEKARIALGAVAPVPLRAHAAEELLKGKAITESLAAEAGALALQGAEPLSKNEYKAEIARTLVKRAILG